MEADAIGVLRRCQLALDVIPDDAHVPPWSRLSSFKIEGTGKLHG